MQEAKFPWFKLLVPVGFCLIIPMGLMSLASLEAASPHGTGVFQFFIGICLGLSCFLGLVALVVSAVFLRFRPLRLIPLIGLACVLSWFVGCLAGGSINNHLQKNTLVQLADRSKPLLAAIKNYEQRFGHPPDSLNALVPEFISKVPTTGIGSTPDYQYRSLTNSSSYGANKWVLQVYHPAEHLFWSTFIYLPQQDYSVLRYGEVIYRIEGWAYWYEG